MPKPRGCLICFVELQRIELANGGAMLFCATCDASAMSAMSRAAHRQARRDGENAAETGGRPAQIRPYDKIQNSRKKVLDSVTLPR